MRERERTGVFPDFPWEEERTEADSWNATPAMYSVIRKYQRFRRCHCSQLFSGRALPFPRESERDAYRSRARRVVEFLQIFFFRRFR